MQIHRSRVRLPALPDFLSSGSGTGSTQPRGSGLENWEYDREDPLRWPRDTLYPQKLALTSPTSGGPSVGIVRLQTKATGVFCFVHFCNLTESWVSIVGITTAYGLDDWVVGVRVPVGSRIFSSPRRPDRLWGPHNLLSNGYRGLFPRG
jgi:hypothetical protein